MSIFTALILLGKLVLMIQKKVSRDDIRTETTKHLEHISKDDLLIRFDNNKPMMQKALDNALDIRKFEIELYWKRATYFWAFIGIIFTAYIGLLIKIDFLKKGFDLGNHQMTMLFFLSSLGLIFSLAWYLVNRGSKYWQENWENIIGLLEDKVIGPSYKVYLERKKPNGLVDRFERILNGPASYSVSKINQIISLYVHVIWITINLSSLGYILSKHYFTKDNWLNWIILDSLVFFYFIICRYTRSNMGNHDIQGSLRSISIGSS